MIMKTGQKQFINLVKQYKKSCGLHRCLNPGKCLQTKVRKSWTSNMKKGP